MICRAWTWRAWIAGSILQRQPRSCYHPASILNQQQTLKKAVSTSNMSVEEGTFRTRDGVKLYTKTWHAPGKPKARLVIIHGFSDHINFYGKLPEMLNAQGISVFGFDQRGWGRSVHSNSDKGKTGPTSQVMEDMTSFIKSLPIKDDEPIFLLGHSMGGGQVLYYAATGPPDVLVTIRGILAEAPFVAVARQSRPLPGLETVGRLLSNILPNMQMVQALDKKLVSRDPQVVTELQADKLCHDTGTLQGLAGMLDRANHLNSGQVKIEDGKMEGGKTRLWVSHGTADGICDYQATKKMMDQIKVKDKEFATYDGWYHKLHDEPGEDKQRYANDIGKWILARL